MEFGGFSREEEEDQGNTGSTAATTTTTTSPSKGKLPFSISSSSSSPSSEHHHRSQHQHQQHQFRVNLEQIYENREMGSFLGSKYDPDEESADTAGEGSRQEDQEDTTTTTTTTNNNNNNQGGQGVMVGGGGGQQQRREVVVEKEHMFDKVVTPSDVGKLNRLVIPKQHAEKYFPLDSSTNEKGLLLNFEDQNGKEWRFRYSYWNSSQSYVMTKGWSRFVKDKKLNAGDIVTFQRGVGDLGRDRLYIDWRRRPDVPPGLYNQPPHHYHHQQQQQPQLHHGHYNYPHHQHYPSIPWANPLFMRPPPAVPLVSGDHFHLSNPGRGNNNLYYYSSSGGTSGGGGGSGGGLLFNSNSYGDYVYSGTSNIGTNHSNVVINPSSSSGGSGFHMRSSPNVGMGMGRVQWNQAGGNGGGGNHSGEQMVYEAVPVVQGKKVGSSSAAAAAAAGKRLRLFGVNMDCPGDEDMIDNQSPAATTMSPQFGVSTHMVLQSQQQQQQQQHPLQLSLYNDAPMPSSNQKGKSSSSSSSSMSFNLDI